MNFTPILTCFHYLLIVILLVPIYTAVRVAMINQGHGHGHHYSPERFPVLSCNYFIIRVTCYSKCNLTSPESNLLQCKLYLF